MAKIWKLLQALAGMPCLFHRFTGLYCPGCGGTRAFLMLLRGRVFLSLVYHPIVVCACAAALYAGIRRLSGSRTEKKEIRILLLAALFLILINTAVKDIALTAFHTDLLQMLDTFAAAHQIVP